MNIIEKLISEGNNIDDYNITYNEEGEPIGYSINHNFYSRKVAKEEDEEVKGEVVLNSAISSLELLQISETTKSQLETEQAMANLESIILIGELQTKIRILEEEINTLKEVD